eukprot:SAG31_NODE_210_length_20286_cov_22.684748_25_plen_116_part_00
MEASCRRLATVCSHARPAVATTAATNHPAPAGTAAACSVPPASDAFCTDAEAQAMLAPALATITQYYESRGIFQGRFGFGSWPAVVVVDFAYGWTDEVRRRAAAALLQRFWRVHR